MMTTTDNPATSASQPFLSVSDLDAPEVYGAIEIAVNVLRAVGDHGRADHYEDLLHRLMASDTEGRKAARQASGFRAALIEAQKS